MSRSGLTVPATLAFIVLTLLAVPAGWIDGGDGAWNRQAALLQETEETMRSSAALHRPFPSPSLPASSGFCRECHPEVPHEGEGVATAFRNQHATSFECLVCHWAGVSGDEPDLLWDRRTGGDGGGAGEGGKKLLLRVDYPLDGSPGDLAALREQVVTKQKCFDRGPGCKGCHSKGRMGRFARPGISPQAEAALEKLPDSFTLTSGKKWYYPQAP